MTTSDWDEQDELEDESTEEGSAGFLGGGGPAETMDEDAGAEADEHGDRMSRADDEPS